MVTRLSWSVTASTIHRHCLRQTSGIAISEGAEIAREIADITILRKIPWMKLVLLQSV